MTPTTGPGTDGRGGPAARVPCIECELIDTPAVRRALATELPAAEWIVLTSRRGVAALASLAPGSASCRAFCGGRPRDRDRARGAHRSCRPREPRGDCGFPRSRARRDARRPARARRRGRAENARPRSRTGSRPQAPTAAASTSIARCRRDPRSRGTRCLRSARSVFFWPVHRPWPGSCAASSSIVRSRSIRSGLRRRPRPRRTGSP